MHRNGIYTQKKDKKVSYGKLYHEEYRINPHPFDTVSDSIQIYCAFHSCWKPGFVASPGGGQYAIYSLVKSGQYCSLDHSGQKKYYSGPCFSYSRSRKNYLKSETLGTEELVRKVIMVHFTPFHELISSHFLPAVSDFLSLSEPDRIESVMDRFYEELGKDSPDQALLSGLFVQLLQEVVFQQKKETYPALLHNALRYIAMNLNDPELSREKIARSCGTSIRTLGRLFTEQIGISVIQYVIKQRLQQVCGMLALSRFSIKEIAPRCGFQSAGFLTAQFRQHFGTTPKQYRKQLFEKENAEKF